MNFRHPQGAGSHEPVVSGMTLLDAVVRQLLGRMNLPATLEPRPRLRGRLHQAAAATSVGGLVWLVGDAHTPLATVAACVYGIATILLYVTSSLYHVYAHSTRARVVMKRLDHSMIYVLIAGTYTPVCLLALSGSLRWVLLGLVWAGALAGIALATFALDRFSKLTWGLYLVLGWAAIVAVPEFARRPMLLALAALGGVLYTIGAVLFALHRPRPVAVWFGYHEFWHAAGIAAGAMFFALNLSLIAAG
jgi:hemolysin III